MRERRYCLHKVAKFTDVFNEFVWCGRFNSPPPPPHYTNICNSATLRSYIFFSFQQFAFKLILVILLITVLPSRVDRNLGRVLF